MKHAWSATFNFKYIKSTSNPDYDRKSNEQPQRWQVSIVFLTDLKYLFHLRDPIGQYIKEHEISDILGSEYIDLQKIEYIGPVKE